ncbi:MAG: DUF2169 domain-containing protein [Burkholderiales bacterium]|nr:DUF2169 domain-containing protein [Burkholderiales bacterium]
MIKQSTAIDVNSLAQSLPTPEFENTTGLDALFFNTLDQHQSAFHVVVAKTAYTLGAVDAHGFATLHPCAEKVMLATEDQHYENDFLHSTMIESDLAPYKPRCDVLVLGSGFAPRAQAVPQFSVQLQVGSVAIDAAS